MRLPLGTWLGTVIQEGGDQLERVSGLSGYNTCAKDSRLGLTGCR